jgi:hypothetical protein
MSAVITTMVAKPIKVMWERRAKNIEKITRMRKSELMLN